MTPKKNPNPYDPDPQAYVVPRMNNDLAELARYYKRVVTMIEKATDAATLPSNRPTQQRLAAALESLSTARRDVDVALRLTAELAYLDRQLTQREIATAMNGLFFDTETQPIARTGHATVGDWLRNPLSIEELDNLPNT